MHSNENEQTPEELAQQARAHALEASLRTMEEFLEQEDKQFFLAGEPVIRATTDEHGTSAEKIFANLLVIERGELDDSQKADLGYEPTRLILLVDPKRPAPFMVAYYEGLISGEKGYGALSAKISPTIVEMESFTSPQHLLERYGDEVVLATARAINDRGDLIGINS